MDINELEVSLVETLLDSDLANIGTDLGEITVDSALEEGVLKDIPVISTLRALWKTSVAVRDELFLKKLVQFLAGLHDIPPHERKKMIDRLENDDSYAQKVGEHIIILLDRLDNMRKPALLAKAFRAYIKGEIGAQDLQRFLYVIDRAIYSDLTFLKAYLADEKVPAAVIQGYVNCGLAWSPPGYATTTIQPTSMATTFLERVVSAE